MHIFSLLKHVPIIFFSFVACSSGFTKNEINANYVNQDPLALGKSLRNSLASQMQNEETLKFSPSDKDVRVTADTAKSLIAGEKVVFEKTPIVQSAYDSILTSSNIDRTSMLAEQGLYINSNTNDCIADTPILVRCNDQKRINSTCLITHEYFSDIVAPTNGTLSIKPCSDGDNCFELWLGNRLNDSLEGNCTIYEDQLSFVLKRPEIIKSLVVADVYYDDYWQLLLSVNGTAYKKLLSLPNDNFPPETTGPCELGKSNIDYPLVDIFPAISMQLSHIKEPVDQLATNISISLKQRVSVTGRGEGYVRLKLYFDDSVVITNELYTNLECLEELVSSESSFSLSATCQKRANTENDCTTESIWPICKNSFVKPFVFTDKLAELWDPFCYKQVISRIEQSETNIELDKDNSEFECSSIKDYDYCVKSKDDTSLYYCYNNDKCVNSYFDESQCTISRSEYISNKKYTIAKQNTCNIIISDTGELIDECAKYVEYGCVLNNTSCLDDANVDICTNVIKEYSCTDYGEIPQQYLTTTVSCPNMKCMGTECTQEITTNEANITATTVYLQALQYMQDDISCIGTDGSQSVSCSIFAGDKYTCREGYYGRMNCCAAAGNVDIYDYIRLTSYVMSLKTALSAASSQVSTYGSWASTELVNSAQGLISSELDSVIASLGENTAEVAAQTFTQEITQKLAEFIAKTFGEEVRNQLFTDTTSAAGSTIVELNPQLIACAQGVMAAYAAYQAAKLALEILTSCKPNEIDTSIKIGLDACLYIGANCTKKVLGQCLVYEKQYCCYNSTLARIVMQELRNQNVIVDTCDGISLDKFAEIDLSNIDLSEWNLYLQNSGLMPNGEYSIESLTGSGSALNTGSRVNSTDRTLEHLSDSMDIKE